MGLKSFFVFYYPQVQALTFANLRARYRRTVAGFLWVLINPVMMFGVQALVFKTFLRINISRYPLFLVSGLLPWIFVTSSMQMCTNSILSAGPLLKSFQLPPLVYLFSQLFDNFINFLAGFILIFTPFVLLSDGATSALFLLPLAIFLLLCGVIGMVWILATVQVFFRDTQFILSFILSIAYFLTPIFYPETFIPMRYRWLVQVNPLYQMIRPFQHIIYGAQPGETLQSLIHSAVVGVLVLSLASFVWKMKKNEIFFNL